jgi:hypothetical protein
VPGAAGADDPCLRRRHLPLEAGTELIIAGGTFPHREDFTNRFIEHGTTSGTP